MSISSRPQHSDSSWTGVYLSVDGGGEGEKVEEGGGEGEKVEEDV